MLHAHRRLAVALAAAAGALIAAPFGASAAVTTYDVNLTFDPNASPSSSLGAAGPGTIKGTITVDTSIVTGIEPQGNVTAANLLEASNNGTILSGFSMSASQQFNTVTPYVITFLFSPVTEYPEQSHTFSDSGTPYEFVSFASPPIIDSIQEGPSFQFDFPLAGGAVIPGNFDSIASTGFNAYLYGTVSPEAGGVPEPATWSVMLAGFGAIGGFLRGMRRRAIAT